MNGEETNMTTTGNNETKKNDIIEYVVDTEDSRYTVLCNCMNVTDGNLILTYTDEKGKSFIQAIFKEWNFLIRKRQDEKESNSQSIQ